MTEPRRVVIVGAGLAAHTASLQLRRNGFTGTIELLGDESLPPYDRPPLSKGQLWCDEAPDPALLARPGEYDDNDIVVRTDSRAEALDTKRRVVTLASGEEVSYDALVIATGTRARTLANADRLRGVHGLRTFADCLTLRQDLDARPRTVIVGAGLIGCEVASHASAIGMDVTVIDPQPTPLTAALGVEVGARLGRMHQAQGTRMLHGTAVEDLVGSDNVEAVRLTDGTVLPAELVLVAFGAAPDLSWLHSSGLKLDRGVICDVQCRTSVPDVYAIGDVAQSYQPHSGRHQIVEHWNNAREQAASVAASIVGKEPAAPGLHYFWTDQVGTKIQGLGRLDGSLPVRTLEWSDPKPGAIHLYGTPERTVGAVGFNASGRLMRLRATIERGESWDVAKGVVLGGARVPA